MTSLESVKLRDRCGLSGTPDSVARMASSPASSVVPRTPKSGDRTRMLRRELFSPVSPSWRSCVGSPGLSLAGKSPRKTRPIPDHFKMQMPTSARKKPVEPGPPSARFSPIVKSTFYGSPSLEPKKKSMDHDESMSSVNSALSEDENQLDSSSNSKGDERQPLKPKNSKDDPLRSKKSVQSGRVTKTKVKRKPVIGGKGVSHGIKKPSKKMMLKKKKQREEKEKKERVARMKEAKRASKEMRKEASRSIIKSATAEFGKSFFEDLVDDDKASNKKARRSGKISIPRHNANVSYEIKNGVPVFSLRRSPRKQQYLSPETPPVISRSTPKLFSPNSTDDYLMTGGNSPARKRSRAVPSPIKFDSSTATTSGNDTHNSADTDEKINNSVKNIITALDTEEEEADMSQDEYAVYVTEDEMAMAVALDAANAATADITIEEPQPEEDPQATIRDILSNMAPITEADINQKRSVGGRSRTPRKGTPRKGTPRKVAPAIGTPSKATPKKGAVSAKGTPVKGTPARGSLSKHATPVKGTPTKGALAMGTPSKRTPAKGTPAKGTPAKGTPAKGTQAAKDTPSKGTPVTSANARGTPANGTPGSAVNAKKNFPIFEGRRLTRSRSGTPTKPAPSRKSKEMSCSTTEPDRDGKKQMVIDAGQKVIGAQHCVTCDFFYTSGDVDEEKLHQIKHSQVVGLVKFTGWRSESNVELHDGRIVVVSPTDPKRHWEKVNAVLEVVDILLGTSNGGGDSMNADNNKIRNPEQTKAFMFVTEGRVVGMLLAEFLDKTDRVSMSVLKNRETGFRLLEDDLPAETRKKVVAGIAKIWVAAEFQRRKIATRLVDAMRTHFLPIKPLATNEFAFSHTTPNGSEFAANYLTRSDFLTYAPVLPGQKGIKQ